ncbi:putative 2og-fe oxygenase protein [Neofusicoccum parvum UCRNP2]|uniref:Putative 2og-fe oxygenase protein n=1 Tax=Botryosphaeria parva (strain UCR-NP2) TaxID=1287680 RepID=R1ESP5_BOTPV|nr:putative 2og-fe oxygenase protein [Neofusicoccum parvum UCRNP2]
MQQISPTNPAKDTPQPLANIKEISLELLNNGDEAEAAKLFHACKEDGVFYLNLRNFDGTDSHLLRTSSDIYQLSKELFDLTEDEKMKYDIDLFGGDMKLNGYKPIGRNLGGIRGKKDGFESYAISKDTILRLTPASSSHPHPDPVSTHLPVLHAFTLATASATTAILSSLSTTLGLPGAGFNAHHRLAHPSPDMLRLLKYAAQPAAERGAPQNAHTDLGTLTVLFTEQAGLQRKKGDGGWEYVEPRPGFLMAQYRLHVLISRPEPGNCRMEEICDSSRLNNKRFHGKCWTSKEDPCTEKCKAGVLEFAMGEYSREDARVRVVYWTDASMNQTNEHSDTPEQGPEGDRASSVVVWRHPRDGGEWEWQEAAKLHEHVVTIRFAELSAIILALEQALAFVGSVAGAHIRTVIVYSDNLRSVEAIRNYRKIRGLGVEVELAWIPAHDDVEGNQLADYVAKRTSSTLKDPKKLDERIQRLIDAGRTRGGVFGKLVKEREHTSHARQVFELRDQARVARQLSELDETST